MTFTFKRVLEGISRRKPVQLGDDLGSFRVEQAFADFHSFKHLLKREGHPSSDYNFVGLIEEVSNQGILSATFAPPRMASTGRFGFSITDPKA